jgi:hypothetical protein
MVNIVVCVYWSCSERLIFVLDIPEFPGAFFVSQSVPLFLTCPLWWLRQLLGFPGILFTPLTANNACASCCVRSSLTSSGLSRCFLSAAFSSSEWNFSCSMCSFAYAPVAMLRLTHRLLVCCRFCLGQGARYTICVPLQIGPRISCLAPGTKIVINWCHNKVKME